MQGNNIFRGGDHWGEIVPRATGRILLNYQQQNLQKVISPSCKDSSCLLIALLICKHTVHSNEVKKGDAEGGLFGCVHLLSVYKYYFASMASQMGGFLVQIVASFCFEVLLEQTRRLAEKSMANYDFSPVPKNSLPILPTMVRCCFFSNWHGDYSCKLLR